MSRFMIKKQQKRIRALIAATSKRVYGSQCWSEGKINPTTGCTKCSEGCRSCYVVDVAANLQRKKNVRYLNGFKLTVHWDMLDAMLGLPSGLSIMKSRPWYWNLPSKAPMNIWFGSMSDIFHEDVPVVFIERLFSIMEKCPQHVFQILTKRPERAVQLSKTLQWPSNLWMGVTVESSAPEHRRRLDLLRKLPVKHRWISIEPCLSAIPNLNLSKIDWVVVGAENGKEAREFNLQWGLDIKAQCDARGIPSWIKGGGERLLKKPDGFIKGTAHSKRCRVKRSFLKLSRAHPTRGHLTKERILSDLKFWGGIKSKFLKKKVEKRINYLRARLLKVS